MASVVLALVAGTTVAACGGPPPKPDLTAQQFVAAVQGGNYAAAAKAAGVATETLAAPYVQLLTALHAPAVAITLDPVAEDADTKHAAASIHTTVTPAGFGPVRWDSRFSLLRTGKVWAVQWTPQSVHPQLGGGNTFALRTSYGKRARAAVLGAGGATLVGSGDVYRIGMTPGRMDNPAGEIATLAKLLAPQGITAASLQALYTAGLARPDRRIAIVTLRESDFDPIQAQLFTLKGVPYTKATASLAPTATFARALLGKVGDISAEELAALGPAYNAQSQVGKTGVEKAFEARLAGTPDASVVLTGPDKKLVATLVTYPGAAGQPVTLTIDPKVQQAAEATLDPVVLPAGDVAALVALQPSTGHILAVANRPSTSSFDSALQGKLPPGSTFKVVSTLGLLGAGVTPDTPVPCLPSISAGGQVFHNFQGESVPGTVPFRQDFAISCNTAFVSLSSRLSGGRLAASAADLGIGGAWSLGVPANTGSVPAPRDAAELASATIGQGAVAVSPLDMAMVAATVASGTWQPPQLVLDPAPAAGPAPKPLDPAIVASLRTLMAGVVATGTAATAFKGYAGAPVAGKTGTAQTADPTKTDAWFIGYRGDLAFAVVVQNGGVGGVVAAPIARKFLEAFGS